MGGGGGGLLNVRDLGIGQSSYSNKTEGKSLALVFHRGTNMRSWIRLQKRGTPKNDRKSSFQAFSQGKPLKKGGDGYASKKKNRSTSR